VDGKGRLSVPFVRRGLLDLGGWGRNSARAVEPVCRRLFGGSNGHLHWLSGRDFWAGHHHWPGHRAEQTGSGWQVLDPSGREQFLVPFAQAHRGIDWPGAVAAVPGQALGHQLGQVRQSGHGVDEDVLPDGGGQVAGRAGRPSLLSARGRDQRMTDDRWPSGEEIAEQSASLGAEAVMEQLGKDVLTQLGQALGVDGVRHLQALGHHQIG
jgi:hypothetical protein